MQKTVRRRKFQPHEGVFTRLMPSPIHGVGVFAILPIRKGTNVFAHDNSKIVWVEERGLERLSKAARKLYEDFGAFKDGQYECPPSFNQLTPAWYVNSSSNPNLYCDENYDFIAARDIKAGEELTIDYSTYSEE